MRKKQEKSAQGYREAVMVRLAIGACVVSLGVCGVCGVMLMGRRTSQEELVPKADPGSREARLEKQKQKGAYAKGREDSPEINESDLMGGGDSFKDRFAHTHETH